ncbi:hypothetical protein BH10ACI2_BH10ACI2_13230 [soil metagenome]
MSKILFAVLSLVIGVFIFACGGNTPANTAANSASNVNSNAVIKLDPANMPPGISASPIQTVPANAVNGPANANTNSKSTSPTPGIPSPAELKKPFKPGATPTPGIPSADEIRKMLGQPPANVNAKPPTKMNDVPMMKSNKPVSGKP